MAEMDRHERLRSARLAAGFTSAADAARRLGVAYGTYSGHENGLRGIRDDELKSYAKAFKCSLSWLAFGIEDSAGSVDVEVVGFIHDGGVVDLIAEAIPNRVPLPFLVSEEVSAYIVQSVFLEPAYNVYDIVLVDKEHTQSPEPVFLNNYKIINTDYGSFYGRLLPGTKKDRFHIITPFASLPKLDAEIYWTQAVVAIIPNSQLVRHGIMIAQDAIAARKRREQRRKQ